MTVAQTEEPLKSDLRTADIIWLETERGVSHSYLCLLFLFSFELK